VPLEPEVSCALTCRGRKFCRFVKTGLSSRRWRSHGHFRFWRGGGKIPISGLAPAFGRWHNPGLSCRRVGRPIRVGTPRLSHLLCGGLGCAVGGGDRYAWLEIRGDLRARWFAHGVEDHAGDHDGEQRDDLGELELAALVSASGRKARVGVGGSHGEGVLAVDRIRRD
jgi:hypothetical protein